MATKETNELLLEYSKQMCVRRQELLEAIRKRSAASIAGEELPPPKRIALSQIKMESLNVIRPRNHLKQKELKEPMSTPVAAPKAAAAQAPTQQQQQQQQPPAAHAAQPETPEMPPPHSPEEAAPPAKEPAAAPMNAWVAPETINGGKWWDSANIAAQLEKQSELSPSAVFEPRLSPINATEIFRHIHKK